MLSATWNACFSAAQLGRLLGSGSRRLLLWAVLCVVGLGVGTSSNLWAADPPDVTQAKAEPPAIAAVETAEEPKAEEPIETIKLAEEGLVMDVPKAWKVIQPKVRIIEHEFALLPKQKEGEQPLDEEAQAAAAGRLTGMLAGGDLQANLDRWVGQFKQPDGSPSEDKLKTEEKKLGDLKVLLVELSGTFMDSRGPFTPATAKPDYVLLGAIIELEGGNDYFLKLTAPQATADAWRAGFLKAVESVRKPAE